MKLYRNGILDAVVAYTGSATSGTASFSIGRQMPTGYFGGHIDDVRLYNYALTQEQVRNIFNENAVRFGPVTGTP
jgi:hypothetical protein